MPKIAISNQLPIHQAKTGNDSPQQSAGNSKNTGNSKTTSTSKNSRSTPRPATPKGGAANGGAFEKTVETAHKNMQVANKLLVLIGENLRISGEKENELERERMRSGKGKVSLDQGRSLKINIPMVEAELHRAYSDQLKMSAKGLKAASSPPGAALPVNAAASLGAASTKASTSVASVGFRSIEEMVGNGLYTPAHGSQMMTPAGAPASTAMQTTGNVLGGVTGLYSMLEGGMTVAAANRIGGQAGRKAGSLGGLTAGLGAGMVINSLGIALGPVGWGALLVGAMVGGGLIGSRLGDRDRWKTEGKRLGKLIEQGVDIPQEMQGAMTLTRGRSKEELVNPNYARDFVGKTEQGFVNNKFAVSRNEQDLQPEDIWGYAAFFEKFGNDWLGKFNEEQRRTIAQAALDSGAVREKHGTINITWQPELETKINELSASKD